MIEQRSGWFRFSHHAMASECVLILRHEDQRVAVRAASEAWRIIDELEQQLSYFIETSEVSQLNKTSSNKPIRLTIATMECLVAALYFSEITNGRFDVTIGRLLEFWRNVSEEEQVSQSELQEALDASGYSKLLLNTDSCYAMRTHDRLLIDLGGIGKGYAADKVREFLRDEMGISAGIASSGESSIATWGDSPSEDKRWRFALKEPSAPDAPHYWDVSVSGGGALAGSGTYHKGVHVIDPRTGSRKTVRKAVWVTSDSAMFSDAISTATMLMDNRETQELIKGIHGVSCLLPSPNPKLTPSIIGQAHIHRATGTKSLDQERS